VTYREQSLGVGVVLWRRSVGATGTRSRILPGYGPRRLSRILRMNRALAAARSGLPWATVAVDGGYSDQAHLCRDVLALAGTSPTTLLREFSGSRQEPSGANRSTGVPSGSWTTA
jgi:AraC-like DNA-binding protein